MDIRSAIPDDRQEVKDVASDREKVKLVVNKKNTWKGVSDFFSSLRLATLLFIFLAVGSILGTVIPQNQDPSIYIKEYGEEGYDWLRYLGFTDLYHSWWFVSLMGLLFMNLVVCTYRRFPAFWKSLFHEKKNVSDSFLSNLKNNKEINCGITLKEAEGRITNLFKKRRYKVSIHTEKGGTIIYASKGILGKIGSQVAHLGIPIILIGTIIGSIFGFKDFAAIYEGNTVSIPQGNFSIRVDKFWIDYYPNDMGVKDFFSALTVLENGKEVLKKTVEVNDPLVYKGIWFYQSTYGLAWNVLKKARLLVRERDTKKQVADIIVNWNEDYQVQGIDLKVKVISFVADFAYDQHEKQVYTKSVEHNNPAVQVEIYEKGVLKARPWIFYNYPGLFIPEDPKYYLELVGYESPQYTGLQVAKDPGVPVVWVGCGFLTAGLLLSSFIFHKRIWVKIRDTQKSVFIHVGGNTNKNQFVFEREFENLIEEIKSPGHKSPEHIEKWEVS